MTVDPKPLYLATSLEKLDALANKREPNRITKLDVLCKAANTLFDSASLSANQNDEERQYIYFTRFVNLVKGIASSHNDIAFVDSRFGRQLSRANERIATVRRSLMKRYAGSPLESSKVKMPKQDDAGSDRDQEKKPAPIFKNTYVTPEDLYRAFKEGKNFIVWDARSAEDYEKSHMKGVKNINIPSDIIKKGYSAHVLSQQIPADSLAEFNKRTEYKAIILMDWKTDSEIFNFSVLHILAGIIQNWDTVKYQAPPFVVSGGFLAWVDKYPTFCTNPHVYYDHYYEDFDELLSLDGISYPSLMLMDIDGEDEKRFNRLVEVYEAQIEEEKLLVKLYQELDDHLPTNDTRSPEITAILDRIKVMEGTNLALIHEQAAVQSAFTSIIHDKETNDKINKLERFLSALRLDREAFSDRLLVKMFGELEAPPTPKEEKAGPSSAGEPSIGDTHKPVVKPEINRGLKPNREPAKPRGPPVPAIDRRTKPKMREVNLVELLRDNRNVVYKGLNGLYNIHNTCYQNTLIQCLRHVPVIATFFLKKQYMHCLMDRKVKVLKEFGEVVSKLWYSTEDCFRPQELFERMRTLDEIYGQGTHEDIHQFLLSVMCALVDDTKYKIVGDESAAPSTKAWYSQLNWCTSFFSENFFHQIVKKQFCHGCKMRSVKYDMENVFMLSIPQEMEDRPFNLTDLMQIYLQGEAPRKVICKKCKIPIDYQRQMVKYPRVAVICIKRYRLQGTYWEKNEQPCCIPEEFRIAETDYKLYAIAQHIGTMTKGHYTAACLNPIDNKWYHFNDNNVSVIPSIHNQEIYRKAYLLFYEAINTTLRDKGEKMD